MYHCAVVHGMFVVEKSTHKSKNFDFLLNFNATFNLGACRCTNLSFVFVRQDIVVLCEVHIVLAVSSRLIELMYILQELMQELYETVRNHKTDEGRVLCEAFIRAPKRR